MATSGVYALDMTARDVVAKAMRELALVAMGDEPEAAEVEEGIRSLNGLLQSWQVHGQLWREETDAITLNAGGSEIVLDPYVQQVIAARAADGASERMLGTWQGADYAQIPTKGALGTPVAYTAQRGRDGVVLRVWPGARVTTTIRVDYLKSAEMVTDANETVDIPQAYLETLWTNLALRLAGQFGAPIPNELALRASELLTAMRDADRPASYFMGAYA